MRKIIIYKDKITVTEWQFQEKRWTEQDISKIDGSITKYFNRLVEIHPDVTVEDFMRHLEKHESVIDYCFSDFSKGVPIRLFLDEMDQEAEDAGFEDIELFWEGEANAGNLAIIGYLRAWLTEQKVKELGEELDIPHDINFIPINSWKKCRFMLYENISIVDTGQISEVKNELIFEGFYKWTLFEVISNFIAELTFNGSPEERDRLLSQMENRKYDVKEVIKSKEKTEFWLLFLSAELEELEMLKEAALEEEEYEKAAQVKLDIEYVEKELDVLREEIKKYND